ncbi:hypothetical protein AGMMS49991_09620 [Spirochaetia bacterium]|nr:hypothetical protein AGMMS49991_09620 [Spirochaetia bacterium]
MKNRKLFFSGILALSLIFVFSGCGGAPELSSNTTITKVTLTGGETAFEASALGTPAPVWADAAEGAVTITSNKAANVEAAVTKGHDKQSVKIAKVSGAAEPVWVDIEAANTRTLTGTTANNTVLGIEIEAEDGTKSYYKIKITVVSADAALSGVTVGGVAATLGTPAATFAAATAGAVTTGQVNVVATKNSASANATLRYALVDTASGEPAWGTVANLGAAATGKFLAIEVKSESGTVTNVYKIGITAVSADAVLSGVTVGGAAATLGTPAATFAAATAGAVQTGQVNVVATKNSASANATLRYALVDTASGEPAWGTTANLGAAVTGKFLAIEVKSESGTVTNVYKIGITALNTAADARAESLLIGYNVNFDFGTGDVTVVGGKLATLGTPAATAAGVTAPGNVTLTLTEASVANYTMATAPEGSAVVFRYAIKATAPAEADWHDYDNPETGPFWQIGFNDGDTLWLEAALGTAKQYYKIAVSVPVTTDAIKLTSLLVAGTAGINFSTFAGEITGGVAATLGTPATTVGGAITAGTIELTAPQMTAQPIVAVGAAGVTYRVAVKASGNPVEADWGAASTAIPNFENFSATAAPLYTIPAAGNVIWVQARAGATELYYKINVTAKVLTVNDAKVTNLVLGQTFDGGTFLMSGGKTASLGTPAATVTGSITAGSVTLTPAEAAAENWGTVTGGPDAVFRWAVGPAAPAADADWTAYGYGINNRAFVNGDNLWIEGKAGTATQYYRIVVTVEN